MSLMKYDRAYALQLLKQANVDLKSAETTLASTASEPEYVCFFARQTVESALKAVLVDAEIDLPPEPGLRPLLITVTTAVECPPRAVDLIPLDHLAAGAHATVGLSNVTRPDAVAAATAAGDVYRWAATLVQCGKSARITP